MRLLIAGLVVRVHSGEQNPRSTARVVAVVPATKIKPIGNLIVYSAALVTAAASSAAAACGLTILRPHVDILGHRRLGAAELVATARTDRPASCKIVAQVFRKTCDVTHASARLTASASPIRKPLPASSG
jgi:hypothetical protein